MKEYKPIEKRHPLRIAVTLMIVFAIIVSSAAFALFSVTAIAADTIISVGPDNGSARSAQLNRGNNNSTYAIEDQYGTVWGTDTQVDIFKATYENDHHEITVAGKNNEKVIAPGTENTYTFAVKNNSGGVLDYKVVVEAWFTGLDGSGVVIPIQARLQGQEWLVGSESEYRPVMELDMVEESATLTARKHAVYTLQWIWPFEQDLDGDGCVDDGDALDTWLASQPNDISLSIRISVLSSYHIDGVPAIPVPVPPIVCGEDHDAYLYGFPDGTIRPEANITRAEVAAIFYRLLQADVRAKYETKFCPFPDVAQDAWYCIEVATLTNLGIIEGYPDGQFHGNDSITRAELAAILARISQQEISDEGKTGFSDIDGHWGKAEIMTIEDFKWIDGYPDGTFRPDNPITRAEVVTMINRMLHRLPEQLSDLLPDEMITWPDNSDTEAWYYLAIQEASNSHSYQRLLGTREKWTEIHEVIEIGKE